MYRLNIVFTTPHADTLGNACRLDMIDFLASHFEVKIITNKVDFIRRLFPNQEIIHIAHKRKSRIPLFSEYKYWKYLANKMNSLSADGVFMFHDDSPATIWIHKPVFQYIHQYGQRSINSKWSLRLLIKSQIEKIKHRFILKGFNKSSHNFVVSTFLIDYFKTQKVINLEFIPHAMELSKFQHPMVDDNHEKLSALKNRGHFIIAYTGWVTENRGFRLMLDSINKIVQQNNKVILVIAGADNNYSKRIAEYQKEFQLQDNIINYGLVDASIIPGILHFANAGFSFLDDVPAFRVSPPQKIFEYFAAGKPVICNNIQTHSMFVENRKTGFVLNMDSTEVANAVLELIDKKDLYIQMCINASNEAINYDMVLVYGKMVKIINEKINVYEKRN